MLFDNYNYVHYESYNTTLGLIDSATSQWFNTRDIFDHSEIHLLGGAICKQGKKLMLYKHS